MTITQMREAIRQHLDAAESSASPDQFRYHIQQATRLTNDMRNKMKRMMAAVDNSQDDLERIMCDKSGEFGHEMCGWCNEHSQPVFECGCNSA